jgi:hypothetical protein
MHRAFKRMRWEIGIALVVKVFLLFILWKICFSRPLSHSVNGPVTAQHVLSSHLKGNHDGS